MLDASSAKCVLHTGTEEAPAGRDLSEPKKKDKLLKDPRTTHVPRVMVGLASALPGPGPTVKALPAPAKDLEAWPEPPGLSCPALAQTWPQPARNGKMGGKTGAASQSWSLSPAGPLVPSSKAQAANRLASQAV